jgi:hypothetical protein
VSAGLQWRVGVLVNAKARPLKGHVEEVRAITTSTQKRLRQVVTTGALSAALAHLLWPRLAIDAVTLALLGIAIVPWLSPIFKSLEFPGGWKVEFQELQKAGLRAEEAGLLAPATTVTETEFSFERALEQDPNLALAGLRIEIEKRLVALAQKNGLDVKGRGLGQLLRILGENNVLDQQARSSLADLTSLLNSAVHGASVDPEVATWAIGIGPRLLRGLDELIEK